MEHSCNPSTSEVESGVSGAQGHPQPPIEFKASQGFYLRKPTEQRKVLKNKLIT